MERKGFTSEHDDGYSFTLYASFFCLGFYVRIAKRERVAFCVVLRFVVVADQ